MRELLLAAALVAAAAEPGGAQRRVEWQAQGVAVVAGHHFAGGGLGVALRTAGRLRLGVAGSAGALEGAAAVRGEVAVSYHADPMKRRGLAPYAAGGVALSATAARRVEFLLVALGVETGPGARAGWFLEAGVAGGVRIAGGVRLRAQGRRGR